MMTVITTAQAADVFRAHAREIMRVARAGAPGFRVMAEVAGDGEWRGAGHVTRGTGSLLAYEYRGYALYLDCSRFRSTLDVLAAVEEWEDEMGARDTADPLD